MVKKGVLKKIINIILSILGICSLGILLVFPFLHNSLEHIIAQWLFYCAIPIFCFCSFSKKTKNDVYNLFLSILVLFILISCFVINYYNTTYNWFWFTFILIGLSIPYGCVSIKLFVEKKREITKEQNKNFINGLIKYTFFYWLVDLFYMSCFLNNLVCKFLFGGLLMVIIFYNLGLSFILNKKRIKFMLIHDFIIGLLLTVYLIYIIPNQDIKDIVIPLVSSVYGGILTLVGVAWTIKHTENNRKKDDIMKSRPYFSYNMLFLEPKIGSEKYKVCMSDTMNHKQYFNDVYVEIENSNLSTFEMKKIYHDGIWEILEGNTIILPNSKCILNFRFSENPDCIFLEIEDSLSNKYFYQLSVLLIREIKDNKYFVTIREIKLISKENVEKMIREHI